MKKIKKEFEKKFYDDPNMVIGYNTGKELWKWIEEKLKAIQVQAKVMQKPKPKTLQAIFEIVDNIDFELAQLEDIAKGEIGDKITLLRKYIDENRVSA